MRTIRALLVFAGLLLVLAVANYGIWKKQHVVQSGRQILLELRPVDPRSLIAGDYMMLRYAAKAFPDATTRETMPRKGTVVLALDADNVATFVRPDDGSPLGGNEVRLRYKLMLETGELRYGSESFHFQEGQDELFAGARYGVVRVDEMGASVLVGLADSERRLISPP